MDALRTNFKDDIFEGSRKFRPVSHADGTASFIDMTDYLQVGDVYGAAEVNAQNAAINHNGLVISTTNIPVANRINNNLYFFYSTE